MSIRIATRLSIVLAVPIFLVACGDDDQGDAATVSPTVTESPTATEPTRPATTVPASIAPETTESASTQPVGAPGSYDIPGGSASGEFCQAFVALDRAFADAPDDPAEMAGFAAERIVPNVEPARANAPAEISTEVEVMLQAVESALATGSFDAFQSPEFAVAQGVVYPSLDDQCGIPEVSVAAVDYSYSGIPSELAAGLTTFVMTNAADAEPHQIEILKLKDGVDMPVDDILAMPENEIDSVLETFAGGVYTATGASGGSVVELTPGRWIYACLIPTGSSDSQEGTGPPHFMEGMSGEFAVV